MGPVLIELISSYPTLCDKRTVHLLSTHTAWLTEALHGCYFLWQFNWRTLIYILSSSAPPCNSFHAVHPDFQNHDSNTQRIFLYWYLHNFITTQRERIFNKTKICNYLTINFGVIIYVSKLNNAWWTTQSANFTNQKESIHSVYFIWNSKIHNL